MRKSGLVSERTLETSDGCLIWDGPINAKGYGFTSGGLAHRVSWEEANGRVVPDGLVIDHLCRVRSCVNPDHLEPVTPGENVRRGKTGALKSECANGHPWVAENQMRNGKNALCCRICHAERERNRQRAMGVKPAKRIDWVMAAQLRREGMTTIAIAEILGTHPGNVSRRLRRDMPDY